MDWFLYDSYLRHEPETYQRYTLKSSQSSEMEHCVKSVQIGSIFWSVFSCTWTEYRDLRSKSNTVFSIQSEYRKIRTRKNSIFGHFSRSGAFMKIPS